MHVAVRVFNTIKCPKLGAAYLNLFLLIGTTCLMANDIDKIRTNEDVNLFLVKNVNRKFKDRPPLEMNVKISDTNRYARNRFFKVDVDNNGLTDLVINGFENLFVILDYGKNNYEVLYIDSGTFLGNTATLISIDTFTIPKKIIIHQSERPQQQIDTLILMFNRFIEYNPKPARDFDLEEIKFRTDQCFGECPIFEMTIKKDRTATYKAIRYNEETGEFHGEIPKKEFEELVAILKYLRIDKLNGKYDVDWTDDQTATTEINYNKKKKIIVDYGKIGTYGLSRLYSKFFGWRKNIEWTE